jgi:nucleoside-diphosphate-sugar epimerase
MEVKHITGLGHVADLATAMAQVVGREHTKGQVYNIQDTHSLTFQGLATLCAKAIAIEDSDPAAADIDIQFYDKSLFDFGDKKAFPLREQHFFCSGRV